jgi:MinD-like ATPase involved in chromosome partitioning or flagellar assembly
VDLALRFGDQQVYFNRTKHPTLVEWVHLLEEEKQPPLICVVETSIPGVRVVLGPKSPEFAELIRPEHIYNLLQQLSTRFDYILLDTADPTDEHLLEILPKIDKFLLLTTSSLSSLKDAALLLNLLSELKVASNKVSVVHSQLHPQSPATAELTEALQQPIAQWLPYEPTLIESSIAQGVPVVASKPNCEFSKAVDRLSDLLRSATPESPSAAPKGKRGWRLSRSL